MKRTIVLAVTLFALLGGAIHAAPLLKAARSIQDQYIVVLKEGVAKHPGAAGPLANLFRVPQIANEMAFVHGGAILQVYEHALQGFAVRLSVQAAQALARDSRVAFIEEDGEAYLTATQSSSVWGLDRINQRSRPLDGLYTYFRGAGNVNVYVIDTGIRATHKEFDVRVYPGYTAINDGRGTDDCNGHGTHVAGTIGGVTYGVAKGVTLYPVRVFDCTGQSSSWSTVIAGVDWVTANAAKPAVANMSIGGSASSAIDTAVRNSINSGVTYVIAAGNNNGDACSYSPSRVTEAIIVGATDSNDVRASFSDYGTCVDLFAPGVGVTSAWDTSDTATAVLDGTSMATPHVAGVAALYLASNPTATPSQVASSIVNSASRGKLTSIGTGSPNLLLFALGVGGCSPCSEASCTAAEDAYISHFTDAGCTGEEHYYTPYFGYDGIRRSWDGEGCAGTALSTVTNRSYRDSSGTCYDAWPSGNTLTDFVAVYRQPTCSCPAGLCNPSQGSYISHYTAAGCTGNEYYYTPYNRHDSTRLSWDGGGCVSTVLQTITTRSYRDLSGTCYDAWPSGNTLSGFVQIYR